MKTFKPLKYEFPYKIRRGSCICNSRLYEFYLEKELKYIFLSNVGQVYVNIGYSFLIAQNVKTLKEAKDFIYYKRKENEEV
jgi:hypothetical protein